MQAGTSPAPFPFETDVLVLAPDGRRHSLQASVQRPENATGNSSAEVLPLSQSLDFATGELTTRIRFHGRKNKWSVELEVLQFVSQTVPSLGLQTVTVLRRQPPTLHVALLPRITMHGLPGMAFNDTTPRDLSQRYGKREPLVLAVRSNLGRSVAIAVITECSNASGANWSGPRISSQACTSTENPSALSMTAFIGVVGDASHPDPVSGAIRSAQYGVYSSFAALRRANAQRWRENWSARVVVSGPLVAPADQLALDASVFYLLASASTASRSGLAIDGYSGLEYGGRIFWDTDLWNVPALALLSAPAAAAIEGFRSRTLDMARRNAGLYGIDGAVSPMETGQDDAMTTQAITMQVYKP